MKDLIIDASLNLTVVNSQTFNNGFESYNTSLLNGNITLDGTISFNGSIDHTGSIQLDATTIKNTGSLNVLSTMEVNGESTFNDIVNINSDLYVSGGSSFTIEGSQTGALSTTSLSILMDESLGTIGITGNIEQNNNLDISGTLNQYGQSYLYSYTEIFGMLKVNEAIMVQDFIYTPTTNLNITSQQIRLNYASVGGVDPTIQGIRISRLSSDQMFVWDESIDKFQQRLDDLSFVNIQQQDPVEDEDVVTYGFLQGYTGQTGYTGSRGQTGSRGYTGSKGDTGQIGPLGYTGSQGIQGVIGYTGSRGYTGSQSTVQGPIGYTGSKGDTGQTGPIGYTGSASTVQGPIGYTGSQGSIGYTGSGAIANLETQGSTTVGQLRYQGTTKTQGQLYGGTTNPDGTTRVNYSGYFYQTRVYNQVYNDYQEQFINNDFNYDSIKNKIMEIDSNGFLQLQTYKSNRVIGIVSDSYQQLIQGSEDDILNGIKIPIQMQGTVRVKKQNKLTIYPIGSLIYQNEQGEQLYIYPSENISYYIGCIVGKVIQDDGDYVKCLVLNQ